MLSRPLSALLVLALVAPGVALALKPKKGAAAAAADAGPADAGAKAAQDAPPAQACGASSVAVADAGPAPGPGEGDRDKGLEAFGKTDEDRAELKDLTQTLKDYEEQAKEYRKEVQLLIEKKYRDKRDLLGASYEKAISDLEVIQRQERLDAIAQFEEFLKRYPEEARYTPDVMYRLAELYYEKAEDDLSVATTQYEAQLKLVEAGKLAVAPPEPPLRFDRSISLYNQLLTQFPDYRYNDGTYYLLGYCLEKQGDFDAALGPYKTLIAKYPGSKFVPEAWYRIGDHYFDLSSDDDIKKSIDAYTHAIAFKDQALFDKGLYKLGWAYYKVDDFDRAVENFIGLLDFYEAKSAASGVSAGGDLLNEALQYTAISFADEKWGSVDKAKAWFARIGVRAYEGEIFRRLGDVSFDQGDAKDAETVAAYRMFLSLKPNDPTAPKVQGKIVEMYERSRDFDKASAEREALVANYGPKTSWAEANKHDPDVIKAAQDLSERSLYSSAIFHHKQALAYKNDNKSDLAFKEFKAAAQGYGTYLDRFPHAKDAYDLTYYYGECLFNSLDYAGAAKQYVAVRDSNANNTHTQEAAEAAVDSLQREILLEQKSGKLEARPVLTATQRKEGEEIKPAPIPPAIQGYIDAVDAYVALFPKCEGAAAFAYNVGVFYYSYNQFDECRKRFQGVIMKYPDEKVAKLATNLIVETYLATKDWKNVEDQSGLLAEGACKADPKSDTCVTLTKFKLSGRFKLADELMAKGNFDAASAKYIQLVDEVQAQAKAGNEDSIREAKQLADKALNNAAVCLEKSQRFDSALQIYERLYKQFPDSPLADNALFRVAVNAEKSYDFDRALERYTNLVKNYPTSKNRPAAMSNVARLLEGDQRYKDAAKAYIAYAETFPDQDDAPNYQYNAAVIYDRMKDYKGEITALQEFQRKFTKNPKQAELIVEAHKKIGDAYTKLGNEHAAKSSYEECVAEYKRRGLKPEAARGSEAAAESAFNLAEYDFVGYDKLKIQGKGKAWRPASRPSWPR